MLARHFAKGGRAMEYRRKEGGRPSATRVALVRYLGALAILAGITTVSFFLVRQLIDDIRSTELVVAEAADLRSEIHKTMLAIDAVEAKPSEAAVLAARSHGEILRSHTDRLLLNLASAEVGPEIWAIVRDPETGLEPSVRMLIEHAAATRQPGTAGTGDHGSAPASSHEMPMEANRHGMTMDESAGAEAPGTAQTTGHGGMAGEAMPMAGVNAHAMTDHAAPAASAGHNPIAMKAVDHLIESLRNGARQEQERAAFIHDLLGYGTLMILLIEAFLVFRPLLKTAENEAERADQAMHELEYLAAHDALTGLLNRGQIDRVLQVAVREAASVNQQLGLILLDLDEFKPINDQYGHAAGDKVLTHVADRIRAAVRPGDICGRLGGDEFIVVLPKLDREPEIEEVARRILNSVAEPVHFNGHELVPHASIGYAMFPIAGGNVEALMTAADLAMYDAKHKGRGRVSEFSQRMRAEAERTRIAEVDLRRAFLAREFEVHYQLIHRAAGTPTAVEALVRWRHPDRGLVGPGEFLREIRRTGRMAMLTSFVFSEALAQFSVWRAARYSLDALHVNVGKEFLGDPGAHEELMRLLTANGVEPSAVVLEITEEVRFDDQTRRAVASLADRGLRIAVDDFGVGSISIEDVAQPAIGIVKLDRSIVCAAHESGKGRTVLRALERLLRAMGKVIIAEGAETAEIAAMATSAGIELLQGYHLDRPCPAAETTARLAGIQHEGRINAA
jgi:diguanylate cyclase (GGDEF)-like protein